MPTLIICLQELVDMVHTLMVVSGDAVIATSCGMDMEKVTQLQFQYSIISNQKELTHLYLFGMVDDRGDLFRVTFQSSYNLLWLFMEYDCILISPTYQIIVKIPIVIAEIQTTAVETQTVIAEMQTTYAEI